MRIKSEATIEDLYRVPDHGKAELVTHTLLSGQRSRTFDIGKPNSNRYVLRLLAFLDYTLGPSPVNITSLNSLH